MIPTNTEARAYGLLLIGMTVAFVIVLVLSGISAAKARQWRTEAERQRAQRRAERVSPPSLRVPRAPEPARHYDEPVTRPYATGGIVPRPFVFGTESDGVEAHQPLWRSGSTGDLHAMAIDPWTPDDTVQMRRVDGAT